MLFDLIKTVMVRITDQVRPSRDDRPRIDEPRTFVLVGHCTPDAFMLRTAIERSVPNAGVIRIDDRITLDLHLNRDHVLLVNRVLDGHFAETSGIELIRQISEQINGPTQVLISNLPSAQIEAEAVGAVPGFGKAELYEESTRQRLIALAGGTQRVPAE